ncbi:ABC transporter permease [Chloroflexi bacterium TSY]|nr:ABC transporter permease [Chloroflexi bacterium TSY]
MSTATLQAPMATDTVITKIDTASQWQLMRWRFFRHKAAVVSVIVLGLLYLIALTSEFIAPYDPGKPNVSYLLAPPQRLRVWGEDGFQWRPFVYGYTFGRDPKSLRMVFEVDETQKYPLQFFVEGDEYRFWGIWRTNLHLFGADDQGRDVFSRVMSGARISLSIGFIGVLLSLTLGVILGGISGYFGGAVDLLIQRLIELLQALPRIPLWLTLSAALPRDWSALQIYFGITIVISVLAWTEVARTVRGKFLSLREEEFVVAAKFLGASEGRIIFRHMVPSFASHLIAVLTLRIPEMILAETSLSFLGLGLQPPVVSWGVLLATAQNIRTVALAPWLFAPGVAIIITVLAFNFVGDGLRDAADPYAQ